MTTSTTINKFRYQGNGVTTVFAYPARLFNQSDLSVEIISRATDALIDTLEISTDYTVTIMGPESAQITVVVPPSNTQDIQIRRSIIQSQTLDLPTGTIFPAVNVENALDRAIAMIQDVQEQVNRSVKLSATSTETDSDLLTLLEDAVNDAEAAVLEAQMAIANVGNIGSLPTIAPAVGDFLAFADISDSNIIKKAAISTVLGLMPDPTYAANTFVANNTGSTASPVGVALAASQLAGRGSTGNVSPIVLGTGLTMTGTTLSAGVLTKGNTANSGASYAYNTSTTAAHGLAGKPKYLRVYLKNISGGTASGYAANTELEMSPYGAIAGGAASWSIYTDTTNVYIITNSNAQPPTLVDGVTRGNVSITIGQWQLLVDPYF